MVSLAQKLLIGCIFAANISITNSADPAVDEFKVIAERNIDISSQVVKVVIKYELTNTGKEDKTHFIHLLDAAEKSRLAYITAVDSNSNKELKIEEIQEKQGFTAYKVELLNPISSNNKVSISIEYHLTEFLKPFPTKITQSEVQYVLYHGNAHIPCAYQLSLETTTVILPPGKLESYSSVLPTKVENSKIVYGPYKNRKAFSVEKIEIHTENNSPFLVATDVLRLIEISHWGNVAVEEKVNIVHSGAELKGSFSRLDFQLDRRAKRPVVTQFKSLLPVSAKDIYYRDEIGNISSSVVRKMVDAVELTIIPRFPLFGGWRTDYILGYNVPAYQYLFSSGNSFALKMRIIDHLFDNGVVQHFKLKIILPEGSKNLKLDTPYPVKRLPDELLFTYLDITGRPVAVIEKNNLVDAHIQQFTLHYDFDRVQLWREPLIACAAFSVLFLAVIIYVRLDFTISPDSASENRVRAQGQVELLTDLHADRLKIYDQYGDIVQKLKNSKDVSQFANSKKKADTDLKNIGQSITDLQVEIKSANADISEKLNEVNKIHKAVVDVIANYMNQAERFVKGQLTKLAFADAERIYNQKINDAKEKMDTIIYAL